MTSTRRLLLVAAALCLLAPLAMLAVDVPVGQFLYTNTDDSPIPGDIEKFISLCEAFSHGTGVGLLLVLLLCLEANRRRVLRIGICAYGAGLMADLCKLGWSRFRPATFFQQQLEHPDLQTTFGPPLAWLHPERTLVEYGSALQSFPSGHTATAAGFAVGLSYFYPRGRYVFFVLVLMAALQRWEASAHFVSDTMVGAAIGFAWGACWTSSRTYGSRRLTRFEAAGRGSQEAD